MIPFPFNENRFSFFVADHLLVGQLCTNPKSDRSLLSCLKVTQDQRCATVQLMLSTDPSYDNWTIASTLKMQIWMVQRLRAQLNALDDPSNGYSYSLWCGFKWEPHHATSHLRSRLGSQHQSVPGCAEECDDPLMQSGGRWQTLGVAAGLGTSPKRPRFGFRRSAMTLYPSLTGPPSPLTWTHWTTLFGHTSRTSPTWPPTTPKPAWSPPSAEYSPCGKGMLPVLDPYQGSDWGWRRLHWIDVSSTT